MAGAYDSRHLVAVVDFHHARGPEVEFWLGAPEGADPGEDNDWQWLPFMALSDGAHATIEEVSYFSLLRKATVTKPATSLFGISCTRQVNAAKLKNRSKDATRSTVQKAVVVISDRPERFGQLRERLAMVTNAWFAQEDFSDVGILKAFQESLTEKPMSDENDANQYLGLSLREMIHDFKYQTLVLFKCCLLQPKMLFFATRCERLCLLQFSLISLIPNLICNLQDCADPALFSHTQKSQQATQLKTSDRDSLLAYMGLPLRIFQKGAFFGPYTPLQQLDLLADYGTKSYVVGSTNSLLLQQKDRYSDVLINLDELSVTITSPSLRTALALSAADRRWIDFLTQTVNETWDPENPSRPTTMGYAGSEEFIRLQFEEYLLALLSLVSFSLHKEADPGAGQPMSNGGRPSSEDRGHEVNPTVDYNPDFIDAWKLTSNYALWSRLTSGFPLFDIVEPKHPTAGGLSVEDVQRRLAQQVAELHLDERVREGREVLGKHLTVGRERVGQGITKLWADIEAMREAQRSKSRDGSQATRRPIKGQLAESNKENGRPGSRDRADPNANASWVAGFKDRAFKMQKTDINQMNEAAKEGAAKAGAYLSSWGSWARERGKEWQDRRGSRPGTGSSEGAAEVDSDAKIDAGIRSSGCRAD